MIDLQANLDRQSMNALSGQIDRAVKTLGKTLPEAVQFGAWAVASTLATSTRVAPKLRKIEAASQGVSFADGKAVRGNVAFRVTSDKGGSSKEFTVYAPNKAAAKKLPQVRIALHGLAKASWGWAQRKLGSGTGAFGGVSIKGRQRAANAQVVEKGLQHVNPYIQITNRLGYITEAMQGGENAIDTVMERAARRMQHVINGKVAKAFGL